MKTDALIAALAADTRPGMGVADRLIRALPAALLVAIPGFVLLWGPRPDIAAAVASAAVLKSLLPLILAVLAGRAALTLSHPEARAGKQLASLSLLGVLMLVAFASAVAHKGATELGTALFTPSLLTCLTSIPALALPLLAAALWALSAGAPRRPAFSGAMAGLVAGGVAATIYSAYCNQDAALFFLPAYAGAILIVTAIGTLIGSRSLAW